MAAVFHMEPYRQVKISMLDSIYLAYHSNIILIFCVATSEKIFFIYRLFRD